MENNLKTLLKKNDMSAVIISDGNNMRYLSGFTGGTGYLYISNERSLLFTDSRYTLQAEKEAKNFEIITVENGGYQNAFESAGKNDEKIGFESNYISYKEFSMLKSIYGERLIDLEDNIDRLRIVKTEQETECIKKAAQIADKTFEAVLGKINNDKTEKEIAAFIDYNMRMLGAEGNSFNTIVASGENSAMPHAAATDKKINTGDFITMDFGCKYGGYCSDMTRTVVFGKASQKQKDIYYTVLEAQNAAIDALKAGVLGKEIDFIARDIINKAGFGDNFGHGLGHSVGLFIHESPRLSPTEKGIIPENCVITVEPGIYIEGFGGVRIEDIVVVKKDGVINLTGSKKQLIEL